MDPILAARLARQQEKINTGESAVDGVKSAAETSTQLDPILARRFAKQQEKALTGESAVECIGSAADMAKQFDPKLAKRLAEQQEKSLTGATSMQQSIGSAADKTVQLDPKLAKRFAEQQEKVLTDDSSSVMQVGSNADTSTALDPVLARRLAEQRSKDETQAEGNPINDVPSPQKVRQSLGFRDGILARRMAEQLAKTEEAAALAENVAEPESEDVAVEACAEATIVRYLPMKLEGIEVLKPVAPNKYLLDNSELKSPTPGMQYRCSKNLDDKDTKIGLNWNDTVVALSDGDGWVTCEIQGCHSLLSSMEPTPAPMTPPSTPKTAPQRAGGRAVCVRFVAGAFSVGVLSLAVAQFITVSSLHH